MNLDGLFIQVVQLSLTTINEYSIIITDVNKHRNTN